MAKANLKSKTSNMKASDLSVEKRTELFQEAFENFSKEAADNFGLGIGVEIAWTPRAAVPRMVLVDLLKKENGEGEQKAK